MVQTKGILICYSDAVHFRSISILLIQKPSRIHKYAQKTFLIDFTFIKLQTNLLIFKH